MTSLAFRAACLGGAAFYLGLGVEVPAAAQDEDISAMEEIIVTASKRGAQSLQDAPIAIQAFNEDMIEDLGAVEFTDLAAYVPSLVFQDLGPGDREYIIRGINSRGTATTGVYYDEAVITANNKQDGGGRQADIELHDMERVEILKGPQGTLYGASSQSGTIRFLPRMPNLSAFEGRVEGTASSTEKGTGNYQVNAMLNAPVIQDKLALRAVGWVTREGGFIDNARLGLKNINSNDVDGIRLALRFAPSERLALTGAFVFQERDVGGSSRFNLGALQPAYRQFLIGFDFPVFPVADLSSQDFTVNAWNENLKLYSIKAEYDAGFGDILLTSNYFTRAIQYRFDSTQILLFFADAFELPILATPALTFEPQSRDQWSNEIRFSSKFAGPFNFVAGAFYMAEKADFEVQVVAANELGFPSGPFDPATDFFIGPPGAAIFGRQKTDDFDQFAFFGEAVYDLSERLQFLAGIRYFEAEITSAARQTKPFFGFPPSDNPAFAVPPTTQSKTTFRFGVNYRLNEDALLYALASSGFRIGGTNDNAINPGNVEVPLTFDPDSLWNYEAGWKTSWLGQRLTFNGAVYFIRWDNMQVGDFNPSSPFNFVQNAGKASVDGIEAEMRARPMSGLDLYLGASWQNARLTQDFPAGEVLGLKGDRVPNVAKFQASASAQYSWPLMADMNGVARMDFSYLGDRDTLFRAADSLNVRLQGYALINAKIGVEGERWQANLFVRNLTDKRAQVDAINSSQDPLAYVTVRPRTFGVNLSTRF
ncbi:MAG: TonB-dependent receptor [Pseudomonadota bacterium]